MGLHEEFKLANSCLSPFFFLSIQKRESIFPYCAELLQTAFKSFDYELPFHCAKERTDKVLAACFTELV